MPRGKNKGIHVKYRKERDTYEVVEYISGTLKRYATGFRSIEDAECKLAEIIINRTSPKINSRDITLGEIMEYYIQEHFRTLSSKETAKQCFNHLLPFWGDMRLEDIKKSESLSYIRYREKKFLEWQQNSKWKTKNKKLKVQTVRRELVQLQACINYAHQDNIIDSCPFIWKPEKSKPRERWLTKKEAALLLNTIKKLPVAADYLYLFTILGIYTGARTEALLSLRWDQIDFHTGFIHFNQNQKSSKKKYSRVPMPRRLERELLKAREIRSACPFVVNKDGEPIKSIKRGFETAYKAAGIRKITPHGLRHTAASWMVQKGVPLVEVGLYIGMSAQMVERVYGHLAPEHLTRARESFG